MLTGEALCRAGITGIQRRSFSSQSHEGAEAQSSMAGKPYQNLLLCASVHLCLCAEIVTLGCGTDPEAPKPVAAAQGAKVPVKRPPPKAFQPPPAQPAEPAKNTSPAAAPLPEKTFEDLVARAAAEEFALPQVDDAKVAATGIRKLASDHLVLYTDLPAAPNVDELPAVFDQAVPQWCQYFGIPQEQTAKWKLAGCLMRDKERFAGTGLLPVNIPDFVHGFQRGSQFWWYPEEGTYFPRHQMLHEGTHAFMNRFLGGAGPPWYMEGMAEMLGLHSWKEGKLALGYLPKSKEEVPYWGRVKIVRDDYAAEKGMMLEDVFRYDARAHLKTGPYGWSWAAAAFLDAHPATQATFRELKTKVGDRSPSFSSELVERVGSQWPAVREDWQLFVINIEYGYDVARSAVVRKVEIMPPPAQGATATIAADRGWQSTGLRLEGGKKYRLKASGRYEVARDPKVWTCEPGGVTIRYHQGLPLGMLLAAVGDVEKPTSAVTPLATPQPIGLAGEIEPASTGTLYLKINDSPAELADNRGDLTITIGP